MLRLSVHGACSLPSGAALTSWLGRVAEPLAHDAANGLPSGIGGRAAGAGAAWTGMSWTR